ncbi:MAG: hypothetical protein LBU05_06015 [Bifidobacteriaceae bacterium]|jgi:hypothetical protein|nr:hypothetical protein [Bifidobacteriaceae bacterium]
MKQPLRARRWLVVLAGVSVISAAAGAVATRLIESPAQIMAEADAPEATIITAVVEDRVLEQTVVALGTAAPSGEIRIGYGRLLSEGSLTEAGGEDDESLAQARRVVREARAEVDQLKADQSSSDPGAPGEQDLARAEDALAQAQAALARLEARVGVVAPRTEIVFVEALPANVAAVTPNVNTVVPEVIAVVTPEDMRVTASVPLSQASLLVDGTQATLALPDGDVTGTVEGRGGADARSGNVPVHVKSDSPLAYSLAGSDIKVTFTTAKTASSVLAAPLGAVSSDSAGRRYVIVEHESGKLVRCEVEVGVTGDALVEVSPVAPGALAAGDRVVISG